MRIETKVLHSGYKPENGGPSQVPIVQSTTYRFDSCDHVAELFDKPTEFMYSRFANPTCDVVEKKIADLEGGVGCMLTSSGQAASLLSILNLCSAGDSFIASSSIYGGTINLFGFTLKKLGIECIWVDVNASDDEIKAAFKPNTKAVFGETIANPALTVFDIERWANVAHQMNCPLIVDNTFATPYLCRPFEWGADIVVHSTTNIWMVMLFRVAVVLLIAETLIGKKFTKQLENMLIWLNLMKVITVCVMLAILEKLITL